jgi:hypothetical protein
LAIDEHPQDGNYRCPELFQISSHFGSSPISKIHLPLIFRPGGAGLPDIVCLRHEEVEDAKGGQRDRSKKQKGRLGTKVMQNARGGLTQFLTHFCIEQK